MQKRGSQPVCSASHIPRFSYDQEPQTLSCPLKRQKGAEERWSVQSMTTASEEQKHWRMHLAWHNPLGQPAGPGWAPLAGSLPPAAGTRVTQWQHSPIAGHAVSGQDDSCFSTALQLPPATSDTDLSSALSPMCGTDRHWSPRRGKNSCSKASTRKMQTPSRGSFLN